MSKSEQEKMPRRFVRRSVKVTVSIPHPLNPYFGEFRRVGPDGDWDASADYQEDLAEWVENEAELRRAVAEWARENRWLRECLHGYGDHYLSWDIAGPQRRGGPLGYDVVLEGVKIIRTKMRTDSFGPRRIKPREGRMMKVEFTFGVPVRVYEVQTDWHTVTGDTAQCGSQQVFSTYMEAWEDAREAQSSPWTRGGISGFYVSPKSLLERGEEVKSLDLDDWWKEALKELA